MVFSRPRSARRMLLAVTLVLFLLRLGWILLEPDLDADAYGHFGIGCNLASDPYNLAAHWVWLPLYHYVLALFVRLHLPFAAVRVSASVSSFAIPWVLFDFVDRDDQGVVARDAAIACAATSSTNVLGVSAQQEALFALLVLLVARSIDARKMLRAGLLLACACLVRYEAWGAAVAIAAQGLLLRASPASIRARLGSFGEPLPPRAFVPPLLAIGSWLLIHRLVDGAWLGFLRELYAFTHMQRAALSRGALFDATWFPITVPLLQFGPALLLLPAGIRASLSRGWIVPAAIYAFLLSSYLGGGSLGGARYYGCLAPFGCAAMAFGVSAWAVRARPIPPRRGRVLLWGSVGILTAVAFASMGRDASARRASLRKAEENLDACGRGSPRPG
jgi:hypothetical protein